MASNSKGSAKLNQETGTKHTYIHKRHLRPV